MNEARSLAAVADSISAEAIRRATLLHGSPLGVSPIRPEVQSELHDNRILASYADAVRDTLLWLTGQPPPRRLIETLDIRED